MAFLRNRYLVAYDITDNKRLNKVHKKVQAYAVGGQKSFYECWLNAVEFEEFRQKITALLDTQEDRCFIFQIDHDNQPLLLGKAKLPTQQIFLII